MKKVVLASFLACASMVCCLPFASAQDAAPAAAPAAAPCAAGAQVQMPAPEYAVYNNAMTQTDPKAKAAGLEQYLTQFPQSCVKLATLQALMTVYSSIPDPGKTMATADRVLQLDPNDLTALALDTYFHKAAADAITDPDATKKQPELDTAAGFAQRGLAAIATKPAGMTDAAFATLKATALPIFYGALGYDQFNKGDYAGAIDTYKKELAAVSPDLTKAPGPVLMDEYWLATSYFKATPPDYLDCAFYGARVVAYAPDALKPQFTSVPKYCYKKYHGGDDGYDAVTAAATANLNPPASFSSTIKPAPTPADIVNQVIATTPDLNTLAIDDKEYILANGTPDQAAKVWDLLKGKSYQLPGALVIASTPTQLQVAISGDAVQTKTADFTINLAPPEELPAHPTPAQKAAYQKKMDAIAAATAVGQTVTVAGTYDSYTPKPIMITLTDGQVILPKAATPKAPVHKPAAHK